MREIKFRAWIDGDMKYIKNEKAHPPYIRVQHDGGMVLVIGEEWEMEPTECIMDVELMQFTGLKDKNGVEIYEGDIVTVNDHPPEMMGMYGEYGVVEYFPPRWKLRMEKRIVYHHFDEYPVEIIGNIYENPSLLEENEEKE